MNKCFIVALGMLTALSLSACGSISNSDKDVEILAENTIPIEVETEPAEPVVNEGTVEYEVTYSHVIAYENDYDSISAQIIVGVENIGTANLYVSCSDMNLLTADGNIATHLDFINTFPQVIAPGETSYIYYDAPVANVNAGDELIADPYFTAERATVNLIRYDISDFNIYDNDYGTLSISGSATNNTEWPGENVYVAAILFGETGEPIGIDYMQIKDDVNSGETVAFDGMNANLANFVTMDSVVRYEVYAYPQQGQLVSE